MDFADAAKEVADAAKVVAARTTTWNGAASHASTASARVDLFAGVLRGTDPARIEALVAASFAEDPLHTLKIVAYLRDIRGGKGERDAARVALRCLATLAPEALAVNLAHYAGVYGRYDDLLTFLGTPLEGPSLDVLADQLRADLAALESGATPVSLCAKWVPSEKRKADKQSRATSKIAKRMQLTCAQLRKGYLSPLRAHLKLLERHMCAKDWDKIEFDKVPSVAMHIHGKPGHAFQRHLPEAFASWKASLQTGATKVNAAALFPHQVVGRYFGPYDAMMTDVDELVEAQWRVLVDHARSLGTLSRTLVMADVSGSMSGLPMMVSLALGILVSEVATDAYKDLVLTFHETPSFFRITGDTLLTKIQSLAAAPWGGSTDFLAALRLVIGLGQQRQLTSEQMPQKLLVVSDMQFNEADGASYETNYEALVREFAAAGYAVPQVIFWNVNGAVTDFPTLGSQADVALISGYSPSVMKAALLGTSTSPLQTMLNAILDARYDLIRLPITDREDEDLELV
ncbi:hypothetical protein ACHHYP_11383 [Achlya hypogyna]|uniref:TROVE domain-containing protein n=1 Tax=Achlya hypogyna TaxID=1202772 RepID=A0A1V9YJ97_ACHHY|nr:hypothetical protein ACHHYP_11383 [Achlya hypogyna]